MVSILVIDDSNFSRRQVVKAVVTAGHIVTEATNGQEGLDLISDEPFDCVITDNLMPVMEGTEMLRSLRVDGNNIPVIMCSADIQETTQSMCNELGVIGFLGKPFKSEELTKLIEEACIANKEHELCN